MRKLVTELLPSLEWTRSGSANVARLAALFGEVYVGECVNPIYYAVKVTEALITLDAWRALPGPKYYLHPRLWPQTTLLTVPCHQRQEGRAGKA